MFNENQIQFEIPPSNWPDCDKNIRRLLPDSKDSNCGLGLCAIEKGTGPFYNSEVFRTLWEYAESKERSWDEENLFITGGIGIDLVFSQFSNHVDQKIYHWTLAITGRSPYYEKDMDFDAYISPNVLDYIKSKFPHKNIKSRTIKGLVLTEITEKHPTHGMLKFQFHHINDSTLSPIEQCCWLSPTNIHKVGVVMTRGGFFPLDPENALKTSLYEQKPPIHLISEQNPLKGNLGRIINGIMIFGLMTPVLSEKYFEDYEHIKNYVAENIAKLTNVEKNVFLEKFCTWYRKIPYKDMEDYLEFTIKRLAKLGLMPSMLNLAEEMDSEDSQYLILYSVLCFAEFIKFPKAKKLMDRFVAGESFKNLQPEILKISRKINWEKVAQIPNIKNYRQVT